MTEMNANREYKIAILVDNEIANDHRVLKEAVALKNFGCQVKIFGIASKTAPPVLSIYGLDLQCFPSRLIPNKWLHFLIEKIIKTRRNTKYRKNTNIPIENTDALRVDTPLQAKWGFWDAVKATIVDWLHLKQYTQVFKSPVLKFNPDIIHAHDLPCAIAGVHIANISNCKLVYDAHEYETDRHARLPNYAWKKRAKFERGVCRRSNAIITVSDGLAIKLAEKYEVPVPTVIFNSPSKLEPITDKKNIRTDLKISANTPLGIYIGHFRRGRGIEKFLVALREFPGVSFAFIGIDKSHSEAKEILTFVKQVGLKNSIYFVPRKNPWELTQYLKTSTFSALPIENSCTSHNHCMPNKLFESVFARVPLVVSPLKSLTEFTISNAFGIVADDETSIGYAAAIKEILENPGHNYYSSDKIKEIEVRYGWTSQAQKLVTLYRQIETQN